MRRIEWEDLTSAPKYITNKDLCCKDCENRYPRDSVRCRIFHVKKPDPILNGLECPRYKLDE